MGIWAKIGHAITLFAIGFEANKAIDNNNEQIIVEKTKEIVIEKLQNNESIDNFDTSDVILARGY